MIKTLKLFSLLLVAAFLVACNKAPSNVHVINTTDCGVTWKQIPTGSAVPKTPMHCEYNVALPNWPMAGDAEFRTQFQKNVMAKVRISYTYEIDDPVMYVKEARYLGKMGGSLELSASSVGDQYELAENIIIDKRFREIMTEITRNIDVITFDSAKLEAQVEKEITDHLKKNGISMGDIAMVIELDELTRLSIDTVTAIRLFESAGAAEVGREVLKGRASATRIIVSNDQPSKQASSKD